MTTKKQAPPKISDAVVLKNLKKVLRAAGYPNKARISQAIKAGNLSIKLDPQTMKILNAWLDPVKPVKTAARNKKPSPEIIAIGNGADPRTVSIKKKTPWPRKPKEPVPGKKRRVPPYHSTHRTWDRVAVFKQICKELAQTSMGITYICNADNELPVPSTVFLWLSIEQDKNGATPLSDRYARAKEAQADYLAEEIIAIADDGSNDYMEKVNKDGSTYETLNTEHVQRSRLRIDTRRWVAAKLRPKKYGDKLELSGDPERPLSEKSDVELLDRIAALEKMNDAANP